MLPLLLAGDIVTLAFYWKSWDRKNVIALFPGAVIGIALGMMLMGMLPDKSFKFTIGVLALVFGAAQGIRQWLADRNSDTDGTPRNGLAKIMNGFRLPEFIKASFRPVFGNHTVRGVVAGIGTGTISALAHLGGLITTLYLLPQNLGNRVFVATSTVIFFLINITKLPPYFYQDLITGDSLIVDLTLLPGLVAGAVVGVMVNSRIPKRAFSWIVLTFVLLTGVKLVWTYM
jgi:uncharacterized protein